MKNKILFLIISLLLIPTFVYAKDTCNDNDIKIKSITLKELNGFSEEVQESTINNNTINLNLKMYDVGDSSTYDITVENTSNEDYYFTKDSMKLENDYLEYSLKNDSEIIHAKEEKTIELKVLYKNQIPNKNYSDTSKLIISLSDKPLNNPKTNTNHYILLIILITIIPISIKYHKKGLLLLSIFGIVSNVYATCTVNLNVETKIEIENKEAIFLPGGEVNIKMKQLAGDDTSTVTHGYTFQNESITAVKYSDSEPIESNKQEKNIVSTSDSPYPIYMWYEDNTIYWWSEDSHPGLNENSNYFFYNMRSLSNIESLSSWDTSKTNALSYMFAYNALSSLEALSNWDVSNVAFMGGMFYYNSSITSLKGIKNWNTSSATNISSMFFYLSNLESLEGLENWNTSNVKYMGTTFAYETTLQSIEQLRNWDTSNVISLSGIFAYDSSLQSVEPLKNWDTSNVTSMRSLLLECATIQNLDGLKNWNTSNVTDMYYIFRKCTSLKSISGIENWNVSKVKIFDSLFWGDSDIKSIDLSHWDVSSATSMPDLFYGCKSATSINVSNWNTSNATDMRFMFYGITLKELDISSFDTRNVTNFRQMFNASDDLEVIYVGENWSIEKGTGDVATVFSTDMKLANFNKNNDQYRHLKWAHYGENGYLTLKTS